VPELVLLVEFDVWLEPVLVAVVAALVEVVPEPVPVVDPLSLVEVDPEPELVAWVVL
jgi:hypothetical protein